MTHEPTVRAAGEPERRRAIQSLVLGFAADPVARWCWPEPDSYLESMFEFADAYGGGAFAAGSAYVVDDCRGAALWLPPGVEPDGSRLEALVGKTMPRSKQEDMAAATEQLAAYHPETRHWFLPLIGVDVAWRGRGLGRALMEHALAKCDADGAVAYLESTNPQNVTLYERHGFRAVGEVRIEDGPVFTPMVRTPTKE